MPTIRREVRTQGVGVEFLLQHISKFLHAESIIRISYVEDLPLQESFLFSMILKRHSTPSYTVKHRSAFRRQQADRVPSTRLSINWVMTLELPIRADSRESSLGPTQLKGLNKEKFKPCCFP
jgi:hypothetical protein